MDLTIAKSLPLRISYSNKCTAPELLTQAVIHANTDFNNTGQDEGNEGSKGNEGHEGDEGNEGNEGGEQGE